MFTLIVLIFACIFFSYIFVGITQKYMQNFLLTGIGENKYKLNCTKFIFHEMHEKICTKLTQPNL